MCVCMRVYERVCACVSERESECVRVFVHVQL